MTDEPFVNYILMAFRLPLTKLGICGIDPLKMHSFDCCAQCDQMMKLKFAQSFPKVAQKEATAAFS